MALPLGLAAGTALAGGIGAGQGYWHFAPNGETMSEADALAKVTSNATLEATAKQELAEKIIGDIFKMVDKFPKKKEEEPLTLEDIRKTLQNEQSVSDFKEYYNKQIEYLDIKDSNPQELSSGGTNTTKPLKQIYEKFLNHIEAYEKLDLKDSPMVQKLTQGELKFNAQQVDGFMKWGYAKAKDLEKIGGEELVKHANASKIALGVGALAVGLGTGALTYLLINKPKTSASSSAE